MHRNFVYVRTDTRTRWLCCGLLILLLLTSCSNAATSTPQEVQPFAASAAETQDGTGEWQDAELDLTGLSYTTTLYEAVPDSDGSVEIVDGMLMVTEETAEADTVYEYAADGKLLYQVSLTRPEENAALFMIQFQQDAVFALYTCTTLTEEKTEISYLMQCCTSEGDVLWQQTLDALTGETGDSVPYDMAATEDAVLLSTGQGIYWLDKAGQVQAMAETGGEYLEFCRSSGGGLYVKATTTVYDLDMEEHTLGGALFALSNGEQVYTGAGPYDFLLLSDAKLRGVSLEDCQITQLLQWADCDLASSVAGAVYLSENTYLISVYENVRRDVQLLNLSFLPVEDQPDKTVLLLAVPGQEDWTYAISTETVYAINAFNRTSDTYRVEIVTYESAQALQLMLTTGTPPDLIVFNANVIEEPASQQLYAAKGYLADLAQLIQTDPELSTEDFLPNILAAFQNSDGSIYALPNEFYTVAAYTASEYADALSQQSYSSLYQLLQALPEGYCVEDFELGPAIALESFLEQSIDGFVDMDTASCDFSGEEFINLLYLCRDFCQGDTALLYTTMLNGGLLNTLTEEISILDEDTAFVGYPGAVGNGAMLMCTYRFCITAYSKNLDGAWEFLRTLFLSKNQEALSGVFFPVCTVAFENRFAQYQENFKGQLEQEEINAAKSVILSADFCINSESPVIDIVLEEAAAFFAGDKTAEEVAALIQSRAMIYLSEQQ